MEESNITIDLNKTELYLIIQSLGASQPPIDLENIQFKLYHKLKFKLTTINLNEFK